jgi:hypothetical protein
MNNRIVSARLLICGVVASCGPEYPYYPPGTIPIVQRSLRGTLTAPTQRVCLARRLLSSVDASGDAVASCIVYATHTASSACDAARGFSIDSMTGRCAVRQIAVQLFNDGGPTPTSMGPGWYATQSPTMTCQAELVFLGAAAPRAGESFEYECIASSP